MKIINYCILFVLLLSGSLAKAQYTLFSKVGSISFDKTMYMKNIVSKQFIAKADGNSKDQFERMLPTIPENVVLKKTLKFNGNETLFEPVVGQEIDMKVKQLIMMFALDFDAQTLSNLSTRDYKRFNDVMGDKVIIQDSVKSIKWRITDEYRDIAGYTCRRANGFTSDSTYVIGFYANEIPISGGPESINGLPGMILGLVVPSQHVSYFATKVELSNTVVLDKKVFENKKTKTMTRKQMVDQFTATISQWLNKETVEYIMRLATL
ncbi:GLPGLI family protein [Sphingobacterium sp. SRCM116780]|uniref:GLPGLI family protein n=1 Tax=Sphingobacterium sp. SRCM116780 TaxID=2907623 RepID=UPI001F383D5F|nr:GLPGLI family protein [Sphingobacterium sp. SRCM116780]UIR55168.1 GLPGLI family protein [Sphingobacterium sp. SRCM116780]